MKLIRETREVSMDSGATWHLEPETRIIRAADAPVTPEFVGWAPVYIGIGPVLTPYGWQLMHLYSWVPVWRNL